MQISVCIFVPRVGRKTKNKKGERGRYRDILRDREKASGEAAREEVMDVGKPTALHSLSLPGIVTPVSC